MFPKPTLSCRRAEQYALLCLVASIPCLSVLRTRHIGGSKCVLSDVHHVAWLPLFSFSFSTGDGGQEKSEKYLSFAMSIVTTLGPDEVPQVTSKGRCVDYRNVLNSSAAVGGVSRVRIVLLVLCRIPFSVLRCCSACLIYEVYENRVLVHGHAACYTALNGVSPGGPLSCVL